MRFAMNEYKESLRFNSKKNIDEMICGLFSNEMEKFCKELEKEKNDKNEKEIDKKIEQVHDRIRKISKLFNNYDRNMEYIQRYAPKRTVRKQKNVNNKVDENLQEIVEQCSNRIYDKLKDQEYKSILAERMLGIIKLLENFDENILYLQRIEMQQTKMGELIFAENR